MIRKLRAVAIDCADLELGATVLERTDQLRPEANWRVYADPAGHPFCLCAH